MDWLKLRETVFSLMANARVYLQWKYRGVQCERSVPKDIDDRYAKALNKLEIDPGVGSASFELKAEEAEYSGDFTEALNYMDKAIEADPRFELRSERWRLMAKSGKLEMAKQAITELDNARSNMDYQSNWLPFLPSLVETYAIALKKSGIVLGGRLNAFAPELTGDDFGMIVSRVNRMT